MCLQFLSRFSRTDPEGESFISKQCEKETHPGHEFYDMKDYPSYRKRFVKETHPGHEKLVCVACFVWGSHNVAPVLHGFGVCVCVYVCVYVCVGVCMSLT
jgi:hypothetical protein